MAEPHDGSKSFHSEVAHGSSAHISLAKESHMAKLDGHEVGSVIFCRESPGKESNEYFGIVIQFTTVCILRCIQKHIAMHT